MSAPKTRSDTARCFRAPAWAGTGGRAAVEPLEARALLANAINVNFQPEASTTVPDGYIADIGRPFGIRANGHSYGWSGPNEGNARNRDSARSPDERYDTLNHFRGSVWELELPNGTYSVRVVAGDADHIDSVYRINVEDVLAVDGTPTDADRWREGTVRVAVTDGRLTISEAPGGQNAKVAFVAIEPADPRPLIDVITTIGEASESGAKGSFTIRRSGGDLSAPLTVQLQSTGTATNGVDYGLIGSALTIPAGAASVTFDVTAVDDDAVEGAETIELSVADTGAYLVGTTGSITLGDNDVALFRANVNFQPDGVDVPPGYKADVGRAYGKRANGLTYGWSASNELSAVDRDAASAPDQRLDTYVALGDLNWGIEVPNGTYLVEVCAGDPIGTNSVYGIQVEGVLAISAVPTAQNPWLSNAVTVTVTDGVLTIERAIGSKNNKLAYVNVQQLTVSQPWVETADLPVARHEAAAAVANGKFYVFGGFFTRQLDTTERVDVYDPATGAWTRLADMPEPLTHAGQAVDGSTIYLAGGFVGDINGPTTQHVWKYDTLTDTWSRGVDLPGPRGAGALVRVGRQLHYFAGQGNGTLNTATDRDTHWVLDLDGGTEWRQIATFPNPRNHLGGVELDGKLYAIGGQYLHNEATTNQTDVHVFDPATGQWTAVASLPTPTGHIGGTVATHNGRIIVAGGVTNGRIPLADVWEYDPAADTWRELLDLPAPRQAGMAGVIDGVMICTGGETGGARSQPTTWLRKLD